MTRVLIAGAGFGGLTAATEVKARMPDADVVLVDEREHFVMGLAILGMLDGSRTRATSQRSIADVARLGVRVVRGRIDAIDPAARALTVNGERLVGDHLILALGATMAPPPGTDTMNLYTVEGVERLHAALSTFAGGRVIIVVSSLPFKCPPAPYEAAMLTSAYLRRRGVASSVTIATPEPQPLPVTGPACGATVREWLEARGVTPLFQRKLAGIDGRVARFEDDSTEEADIIALVPPHHAPHVLREAGLVDASGWVPVDRRTCATRFDGVWAVGDCTIVKLANGKPLVKAGIMAEGEARVVARRIAGEDARFEGKGGCFLELGDGEAVEVSGDFYAEPDPVVSAGSPTKAALARKAAFEKERLDKWFGPTR